MDSLMPMLWETLFGFFALFVLTKVLGKTQISQLTAFDFIAALVLGELVGNALFDPKAGIMDIAFVVVLWGVLLYITELVTQKFKRTRGLLEGNPAIVIHKGQLIKEVMKKNKLDINQLQHLLRSKNAFSVQEVEYAILESDGSLSVLKKPEYQSPTKKDLNVAPGNAFLAVTLINDGEILWDNLREANLNEEWLHTELNRQNFQSVKDIFFAEYVPDKKLFILPFVERKQEQND
ncbi:YetF domain-containing protein [Lentibacillus sp. Marseille-P4043]|uniref:YetF domain-containing protein n=1 Tax=Lentibacillus sp. Marseille-P4043 TaxID=2040293 RepID=UPI000D0ACD26|nr:DUF421 domain-containing protein [Lentibacillus sp. Marseille-P4043]